ncbi:toll/interleukin-1 receptor domain-containing protein [Streptomyces sp. NPDC057494]|uniref:toll/interleukin-1 receptor domain-containing protein n=1 Tax=Streptomyces sp. NPDC057494 TaxID=3346148 RepID=UPI003699C3C5
MLIPLVVYFPSPSLRTLWRASKTGTTTVTWTWRRLPRPEALAPPLVVALITVGLTRVAPDGSFFFWFFVVCLPIAIVLILALAGYEVTVDGRPLGQEVTTRGGKRLVGTPERSLLTHALVAIAVMGAGAWYVQMVGRSLVVGGADVAPGMERAARAVQWLDAQFSVGVFGPTYAYQQYWAGLVAGAGLLAAAGSVLLRDWASRADGAGDPFDGSPTETRSDAPVLEAAGKVFLSYSRKNSMLAHKVRDGLEGKLRDIWVDWEAIEPSERWRQAIDEGIRTSDAMIVLLSNDSLRSPYCRDECMRAIDLRKRILPVVIDPSLNTGLTATMNEHGWERLREYQSFPMTGGRDEDIDRGVERIASFVTERHRWDAFHTRLGNLAHEWSESGCRDGLLLRSEELSLAGKWQGHPWSREHRANLTDLETRYLQHSRRAVKRRATRLRLGLTAAVAVVAALGTLVVSGQAEAEAQRRSALSRKLAAASLSLSETEPEKAVQLSLAAYGQAPTAEAESALASHLAKLNGVRSIISPGKNEVTQLLLGPGGRLLFIERGFTVTQVWDVESARSRGTLQGSLLSRANGGTASLTADGRTLALRSGERNERIDLVDTGTLRVKDSFEVPGIIAGELPHEGGGLSPDGKLLMAGGMTGGDSVPVWDVPRHRILKVLSCQRAQMAPSGKAVACGQGQVLRILALPGLQIRQTIATSAFSLVGYTASDGVVVNYGETVDDEGEARVYEPGGLHPWVPARDMFFRSGSLLPGGQKAVLASTDLKRYELWDLQGHKRLRNATGQQGASHALSADAPVEPVYSEVSGDQETETVDGRRVATLTKDGSVVIWDRTPGTGRLAQRHALPKTRIPWAGFAVSADTNTVAVADGSQPVVHLLNSSTGAAVGRIQLTEPGTTLAFNGDGSLLAVAEHAGAWRKSPVEVFQVPSGRSTARLHYTPGLKSGLPTLLFSPDSRSLYGTLQGETRVVAWALENGSEIRSYGPDPVSRGYADHAALSADGATLALTDRQMTTSLWKTASGGQLSFTVKEAAFAAFSPDGRTLASVGMSSNASGEAGGSVTLWDVTTQRAIGSRLMPDGGASRVLFSPDGRTLAVVGNTDVGEAALSLWDVASHRKVGPDLLRTTRNAALDFTTDGSRIVVADERGFTTVRLAPGRWVSALCGMLTSPLSQKEWQAAAPWEQYRSPCRQR